MKISNLFKILAEREISAKKLSDDTGISTGNISDWKSVRSQPSINALITIANYLNVSIDYLVGRTKSNENRITIKDYYELVDELIATDTLSEQGTSSPPKYIVISRFDDVGNIVMLSAIEKKKGKYSFGGYVPFFEASSKQLQVNFNELFEFFEYVQKNNINIIFDGQFFQDNG